MRTVMIISLVGVLMISCGKNNIAKSPKRQKTPSHLVMSQDEKIDVNYDARETKKAVTKNLQNKEANLKAAKKQRDKHAEDLNRLNENSSKVRKKKVEAFSFY